MTQEQIKPLKKRARLQPGVKLRDADKVRQTNRIAVTEVAVKKQLAKPKWIRVRASQNESVKAVVQQLREQKLHTVCEEASCPNLAVCFGSGTATFMILGAICTRRCPFCDVAHGRPLPVDPEEPKRLAKSIAAMKLRYVVITSVDRDDLDDGGATQFMHCIREIRSLDPEIRVEILVPDFRGRRSRDKALSILMTSPPDVFNHNLETVPELYKQCRPGADYQWSLNVLKLHKEMQPNVPTKSGLMLGLGETRAQVEAVLKDMRAHHIDRLTMGQYLQPSPHHLQVERYVTPEEFDELGDYARSLGFSHVMSGPLVRSSYHAQDSDHCST